MDESLTSLGEFDERFGIFKPSGGKDVCVTYFFMFHPLISTAVAPACDTQVFTINIKIISIQLLVHV